MDLFIDTNIYLTFYHYSSDDLEELKKLQVAIKEGKICLLLPVQIIEEFRRNREGKIADALSRFEKCDLSSQFPQMCKDYPQYQGLRQLIMQFDTLKKEMKTQLEADIIEEQLGADKLIEDLFESAYKIEITAEILDCARTRFDKGNPPGKNNSYGDAINWESLLSLDNNTQSGSTPSDLNIIARDKDYSSPLDRNKFSRFLQKEWNNRKGSKVNYFTSLSSFFNMYFPDIKLASELEKQFAISRLVSSTSFARTHLAIAKLERHVSSLSSQKVDEIVDGLLTNPQIFRIYQDEDVQNLVKQLIDGYEEIINEEEMPILRDKYGVDEQDLSTESIFDDDIPF